MHKTIIVVWSEDKPDDNIGIEEVADMVHSGEAFCASIQSKKAADLADDVDMTEEVIDFFDLDECDVETDDDSDGGESFVDVRGE